MEGNTMYNGFWITLGTLFMAILMIFYSSTRCEYTKVENITKNITVPISRCDVSTSNPNIVCYNTQIQKEITEEINVTYNDTCKKYK